MGLETLALASLIVAGAGTAYSVYSNEKAKDEADRATEQQIAANTKAAEAESERIRFNADRLKKAQRASAAKAGLVTNVGTALDVQKETDFLANKDIRSVMETRDVRNQGALSEARMFNNQMNASSANSMFNFANTALGAVGTMKKNSNFVVKSDAASKPAGDYLGSSKFKDTSTGPYKLTY